MKKILRTALLLFLTGVLLAGCGKSGIMSSPVKEIEYPSYDSFSVSYIWANGSEDTSSSSDDGGNQSCKHVFGPVVTVTEATCTEKGTVVSVCTLCGWQRNGEIPEKGHDAVTLPGKAATCTSSGLSEGIECLVCGAVLQKQERIPATDHELVIDIGSAATCNSEGFSDGSHCAVCGTLFEKQTTLPKLEHSYSGWTIEQESTCSTNGVRKRTCWSCGEEERESLERTKHTYLAGRCSVCGQSQPVSDGLRFSLSSDGSSYVCDGFASYTASDRSVVIPSTYNGRPVTAIGDYAFYYKSIEYVELPGSITKIGDGAFGYCNKLTSVTIPNSVTRISCSAFSNCGNLETVYINTSGWKGLGGSEVDFSDPYNAAQTLRKYQVAYMYKR